MAETIDIGTVSSRGQVAIPSGIRNEMHLKDGERVFFMLQGDTLLMKKVESMSWDEITKPLREAAEKAGMKKSDVPDLVHRIRKQKK